jgi:hypothetical protein
MERSWKVTVDMDDDIHEYFKKEWESDKLDYTNDTFGMKWLEYISDVVNTTLTDFIKNRINL